MGAPVVAGLAIGIAFIVAFSILTNNTLAKPVSDIKPQDRTEQLPEVKAFLSKYPDAHMEVNRYQNDHTEVVYSVERPVFVPEEIRFLPDTHTLSLWIEMTSSTGEIKDIYVKCGATMTERATTNLIEYVDTTDCLNPNWDDVDYGQHEDGK